MVNMMNDILISMTGSINSAVRENNRNSDRLLRIIAIVIGIMIIAGGTLFYVTADSDDSLPNNTEFDVDFTDEEVYVTQTNGEVAGDNIQAVIQYRNGATEEKQVTFSQTDERKLIRPSERVGYIETVTLVWTKGDKNQQIDVYKPPNDISFDQLNVSVSDKEIRVLESVKISGSDYVNRSDRVTNYTWRLDKKGNLYGDSISVSYDEEGVYNGTLVVTDEMGDSSSSEFQFVVYKPELINKFENIQNEYYVGQETVFNGFDVSDESAVSYEWRLGDVTYSGPEFAYTFSRVGDRVLELTVKDAYGYQETRSMNVSVVGPSEIGANIEVRSSDKGTFTFTANTGIDVNATYKWEFGNGKEIITDVPEVVHKFQENGNYSVSVTVQGDNGISDTGSVAVIVEEADEQPVTINMNNRQDIAWNVDSTSEDYIISDEDQGSDNPTVRLQIGERYTFTDLPDAHPIEFRDRFGNVLLSQRGDGSYQSDSDINWEDNGSSVSFTVTNRIANQIAGYQSYSERTYMDGRIEIIE